LERYSHLSVFTDAERDAVRFTMPQHHAGGNAMPSAERTAKAFAVRSMLFRIFRPAQSSNTDADFSPVSQTFRAESSFAQKATAI
jgi:hypothetical protein